MTRITIGQLKQFLSKLPNDGLIVLDSDAEGNEQSTLLCWDVVKVGEEFSWRVDDQKVTIYACENTHGIDLEKDKGKTVLVLTPSL